MQAQTIIRFTTISFIFFITACMPKAIYVKPENMWKPPQNVAVLPFDNMSNDEEGPILVRSLFARKISEKGFFVQDPDETDEILRDMGITYGGQLKGIPSEELAKKLGVDGLFYGTVLNFEYTIGLFETKKIVRLNARLVDGWRDELFWEAEQESQESKSRIITILTSKPDEMLKNTAADLGGDIAAKVITKSLEGLLNHPLYNHSDRAVNKTIASLPYCEPGYMKPVE
jgi:hypothetical protein